MLIFPLFSLYFPLLFHTHAMNLICCILCMNFVLLNLTHEVFWNFPDPRKSVANQVLSIVSSALLFSLVIVVIMFLAGSRQWCAGSDGVAVHPHDLPYHSRFRPIQLVSVALVPYTTHFTLPSAIPDTILVTDHPFCDAILNRNPTSLYSKLNCLDTTNLKV